MCCESFDESLLRRFRRVSTILATVAVKKASCLGRSSERLMRDSSVPVFESEMSIPQSEPIMLYAHLERWNS